jgi:hypothetical protein
VSIDYAEAARLIRKGRKSDQRGKALSGCITSLLTKVFSDLTGGWMFMLAVGIAHAEWIQQLPTIGYWWAVLIVALTRGLFGTIPSTKKGGSDVG